MSDDELPPSVTWDGRVLPARVSPKDMIPLTDAVASGDAVRSQARQMLAPGLATWCKNVLDGLRNRERTAMHLWGKAMGLLGADVEVNMNLLVLKELGVDSLAEAKRRLDMVAAVEGIEDDDAVTVMEQHVRDWYRRRGKRVVILDDAEQVKPTNGSANGV